MTQFRSIADGVSSSPPAQFQWSKQGGATVWQILAQNPANDAIYIYHTDDDVTDGTVSNSVKLASLASINIALPVVVHARIHWLAGASGFNQVTVGLYQGDPYAGGLLLDTSQWTKVFSSTVTEDVTKNLDLSGVDGYNPATDLTNIYLLLYATIGHDQTFMAPNIISAYVSQGVDVVTPPATPSNLSVSYGGDAEVNLNWDDTVDATSYVVKRNGVVIASPAVSNYQDILDPLVIGEYCYAVSAVNSAGASSFTNESCATVTGIPKTPTNLVATLTTYRTVTLTWDDNSSIELGYRVYRKFGSGAYVLLATTAPNIETYLDTIDSPSLISGSLLTYKVVAFTAYGTSESNEDDVTLSFISKTLISHTEPLKRTYNREHGIVGVYTVETD